MSPEKIVRTIVYFALISMFTACQSDCDCGENPYRTDLIFNTIKTTSIDNSDEWVSFEKEATTIPYKAIGVRVAISDTIRRKIVATTSNPTTQFHCTNWYGADSFVLCDWFSPRYTLIKKISAIRMITLYDFSPEYPAGSELSELFKAYLGQYQYEPQEYLYTEMDSAIRYFETMDYYYDSNLNIDLVLAQPALCDSMRLEISVEFDDNSALTDTTSIIYPIH